MRFPWLGIRVVGTRTCSVDYVWHFPRRACEAVLAGHEKVVSRQSRGTGANINHVTMSAALLARYGSVGENLVGIVRSAEDCYIVQLILAGCGELDTSRRILTDRCTFSISARTRSTSYRGSRRHSNDVRQGDKPPRSFAKLPRKS